MTHLIPRSAGATGGTFSVAYKVERSQSGHPQRAFLKALDFSIAPTLGLPIADALQLLTNSYVFERDLVMRCANHRMRNVILGLDAGQVTVTDPRVNPILADVPYIILEEADGDVRTAMTSRLAAFDQAWAFRVLHGVANGLRQLHQDGISHQDIKPSNVMTIDAVAKIGDLGRAGLDGGGSPHDGLQIAGDPTYAPPELLYGELQPDDRVRRRACDVYHLGSMLVFFYTGSGLTPLIETELAPTFHWRTWPRDFRNVLPYVRNAFDQIVDRLAMTFPDSLRAELTTLLRQLGDPDPLVRGSGTGAGPSRYSMERYVSHFDRLARKAEWGIAKGPTP